MTQLYTTLDQSIKKIQQIMKNDRHINFIFVAGDKNYKFPLWDQTFENIDSHTFRKYVEDEGKKISNNLKMFIKTQKEGQSMPKYIKLDKQREVMEHLRERKESVTVEFFYQKKEDTIKRMIFKMDEQLNVKMKELTRLTDSLKYETSQHEAINLIRRDTSISQQEQIIKVFLVVCDPLIQSESKDSELPIYDDQIDIPNHLERLRKSSLACANLSIKVCRVWGTKQEVSKFFNKHKDNDINSSYFSVVQIFTRVEKQNNKTMISLEGQDDENLGKRVWIEAADLFKEDLCANILIVVGVGVNLLKEVAEEVNFNHPLILITTISLENTHAISTTHDRSLLDIENIYNDNYCQTYLEYLYSDLFKRKQLGKCHQKALAEASQTLKSDSANKTFWCCCLHPHHPSCGWQKIVKRIGQHQAHRLFLHDEWPGKKKQFQNCKQLQNVILTDLGFKLCHQDTNKCCFKLMDRNQTVKAYHNDLKQTIIWNGCEPNQIFGETEDEQRPNRFDCETHQKPTGRKCPLTVYRTVKKIIDNQIIILRAPIISEAKRFFSYSKEYIQIRRRNLSFYEYEVSNFQQKSNNVTFGKKILELLTQRRDSGSEIYISLQYSHQKTQKYYQQILKEFFDKNIQHPNRLKLILITQDQQFSNQKVIAMLNKVIEPNKKEHLKLFIQLIQTVDIEEPDPSERYNYYLSQYSYDSVMNKIEEIKHKIRHGEKKDLKEEKKEMERLKLEDEDKYMFLGFLSQFNEDGFYLGKVSLIILEKMFSWQKLDDKFLSQLPVECIQMEDNLCLQLYKSTYNYFSDPSNIYRLQFQQKKLQFYYLRMRLYFQYWPTVNVVNYPGVIRNFINKEGIFSINIEKQRQSSRYNDTVAECKLQLDSKPHLIKQAMHDITNSIHVYHLNQVQKILQEFLKKKQKKHNPFKAKDSNKIFQSGSYINEATYRIFQYLLWNIILNSWLMSRVLVTHYAEAVRKFETVLLVFFIQAEINLPIAEVARIQLYVLMNKAPPKIEERDFGKLTAFLGFYRNFAFKELALSNAQPQWGSHRKCKQLFGNCFFLAYKIGEMLNSDSSINLNEKQKKQHTQFRQIVNYKHPMFKSDRRNVWPHECLKLIERKVLYYFNVTSELKKNMGYDQFSTHVKTFETYFRFKQLLYEFDKYKNIRLEQNSSLHQNTQLIEYYLQIQKQEQGIEVDDGKLKEFKGKISPQYMPIFNYLCQKIEQKALFNKKGLVIFARARTIVCDDQPYIYTRRRSLLTTNLGKVFVGKDLKISYCPLTDKTFHLFETKKNNYICQILCMILTIDSTDEDELMFGTEEGVDTVKMSIQKFAEKISRCRIKILILCGKNATRVCDKLQKMASEKGGAPDPNMAHSLSNVIVNKMAYSFMRPPSDRERSHNMITTTSNIGHSGKRTVSNAKDSKKSDPNTSRSNISKVSGSALKTSKKEPIYFNNFPTIIAIESQKYSLGDVQANSCPKNYVVNRSGIRAETIVGSQSSRPSMLNTGRMKMVQQQTEQEQEEDIDKILGEQSYNIDLQESTKSKGVFQDMETQKEIPYHDYIFTQLPKTKSSSIKQQNEMNMNLHLGDISRLQGSQQYLDVSRKHKFPIVFEKAESENSTEMDNTVENYLCNEVHGIAMDLMIIVILKNITNELAGKSMKFDEMRLRKIIDESKKMAKNVLSRRFDCASMVMGYIKESVWVNDRHLIQKINEGQYQDLTKKFYIAENNLHDENYYENIGNCKELQQAFKHLRSNMNCIQIVGGNHAERSSLLQEISWIANTKSLFKFGIIKVDLKHSIEAINNRTYKNRQSDGNCQTGLLIAVDHMDEGLIKYMKELKALRDKSFTLIYTSSKKEECEKIRETVNIQKYQRIDLDSRSEDEYKQMIYASMLAHLKQKNQFKFTNELISSYQSKIDQIIQNIFSRSKDKQNFDLTVSNIKGTTIKESSMLMKASTQSQRVEFNFIKSSGHDKQDKLERALQILRGSKAKNEDQRAKQLLHFYQQHYDQLFNYLQELKQITVKII